MSYLHAKAPASKTDVAMLIGLLPANMGNLLARFQHQYYKFPSEDGKRKFYDPSNRLRSVQSRIKSWLDDYPLPDHVDGWRSGRCAVHSARPHVNKYVVVKIDIKDFFPSITHKRVRLLFKKLGCTEEAASVLTMLTTADGHLPQGFITSPVVANLLLRDFDRQLISICGYKDIAVRRFGDDISVSSMSPLDEIAMQIKKLIEKHGFKVNESKFALCGTMFSDEPQEVCGIEVNHGLRVTQSKYDRFEAFCEEQRLHGGSAKDLKRVRGMISHTKSINKQQGFHLAVTAGLIRGRLPVAPAIVQTELIDEWS